MKPRRSIITSAPLLVLLIFGAVIVTSPKQSSAFLQGHRTNIDPVGSSHSTPCSIRIASPTFLPSRKSSIITRAETKIYKSKSDKDDDSSSKRSWFKPWKWFVWRERRKRQPKLDTMQTLLLAYKEAKDLGIINSGSNTIKVVGNTSVPEYIDSTIIAQESIRAIVAAASSDRPLIIDNTFVGNTYMSSESNGLEIFPAVKFRNDMSGAFHENNNAAAKFGNVSRQNGVADFVGVLRNNNNAASKSGDVSRMNGVFDFNEVGYDLLDDEDEEEDDNMDDDNEDDDEDSLLKYVLSDGRKRSKSSSSQQEVSTSSSATSSSEGEGVEDEDVSSFFSLFDKARGNTAQKDKAVTRNQDDVSSVVSAYTKESLNSTISWYEVFNQNSSKPPVDVRNTYVGNKYERKAQNGLSLGVTVDFKNDMPETFYHNNNAVAHKGDVSRQNGVADFTDALRRNNDAVSASGDVQRDNGADVSALSLLLPLLDLNITLPVGSNSASLHTRMACVMKSAERSRPENDPFSNNLSD